MTPFKEKRPMPKKKTVSAFVAKLRRERRARKLIREERRLISGCCFHEALAVREEADRLLRTP